MRQPQRKSLKQKGFTIIEILIVITIIGILTTGALLYQQKNIRRKKVETEALKVKQMIELTRDYALTGELVNYGGGNKKVPDRFRFMITSSTHYQIEARGSNKIPIDTAPEHYQTLDSDVRFKNTTYVEYLTPDGRKSPLGEQEIILCAAVDPNCKDESLQYKIIVTPQSIQLDSLTD